mgnify:CR=1 FL=1
MLPVAGDLPQHVVAQIPHPRRKARKIRTLEVERSVLIMGRIPLMNVVIRRHHLQRLSCPRRPNRGCIKDALVDSSTQMNINAQPFYFDRGRAAGVGEGATTVVVDTGAEI